MYLPAHFEQSDPQAIADAIAQNPLATLVTRDGDDLVADHLPLLLEGSPAAGARLIGHVAIANDVWRRAGEGARVLAVFQGPHAYVSPNWYPSKREHHRVVPTYNYVTVQINGTLHASQDPAVKRRAVEALTARMESTQPAPWKVADAPPDYLETMLAAIVAIELRIDRVQAKWKVSQNRSADDRAGVAQALVREAQPGPARQMGTLIERGLFGE
ncbi:MAG: FMN-binding negative transcriptional regulator [Burkholderiales bacterium]